MPPKDAEQREFFEVETDGEVRPIKISYENIEPVSQPRNPGMTVLEYLVKECPDLVIDWMLENTMDAWLVMDTKGKLKRCCDIIDCDNCRFYSNEETCAFMIRKWLKSTMQIKED